MRQDWHAIVLSWEQFGKIDGTAQFLRRTYTAEVRKVTIEVTIVTRLLRSIDELLPSF